jgi:PAS domain S-box-containing protein
MAIKSMQSSKQTIDDLQKRLKEAEETLNAIRQGSVDALVVKGNREREIFTLRSADYSYRMLIESMNQGAFTINFDGTILYSNRKLSTMLKTPLEQIIGSDILLFVTPEYQQILKAFMQSKELTEANLEICLQPSRSKKITVIASINTVHQQDVNPYLCVVVTDLTERKQAEVAKDEFISLASHQLRTPATLVKQYINMLIDGLFGELNNVQIEALQKANDGNERELKIVEDLLKVAQIDAGKVALNKSYIDINNLIKQIIAEYKERLEKKDQKIIYDTDSVPVIAHADPSLIRTVIENLIDNASKYMFEKGTIIISCEGSDESAVFSIRDEGVGISKKEMPKLFQKFSRLSNDLSVKVGGNGLGLYWVKKVIDLHASKITVSSTPGKGTTFTVTLPKEEVNEQNISS